MAAKSGTHATATQNMPHYAVYNPTTSAGPAALHRPPPTPPSTPTSPGPPPHLHLHDVAGAAAGCCLGRICSQQCGKSRILPLLSHALQAGGVGRIWCIAVHRQQLLPLLRLLLNLPFQDLVWEVDGDGWWGGRGGVGRCGGGAFQAEGSQGARSGPRRTQRW